VSRPGGPRPADREARVNRIIETARAKPPRFRDPLITLAHGAGGRASRALIEGMFVPAFSPGGEGTLAALGDAGSVAFAGGALVLSTDSFVVRPLRFPGGSIGELAVNGTVNDLAVSAARPLALTVSMILEEGLDARVLAHEVQAIARAARTAGIEVVAGDTKVVERGAADGMYLCTAGVGAPDPRGAVSPRAIRPGDAIIVSGPIAEHGTAIMLARGSFELDADVRSDTCSLWPAVDALLGAAGAAVHCMRDATRGGIASALNELARASAVSMLVREADVPVSAVVRAATELLGIDPVHVANEGRLVAFVAPERAADALAALRAVAGCEQAVSIGEVGSDPPGMVLVSTDFGGRRVMDELVGDPLPRIC
jgi:hydrogenase expression/formation protein HypE